MRLKRQIRVVIVAVGFYLGATLAIGSVIAAKLEVDGFGSPQGETRALYVLSLAVAAAVSAGTPFVLARLLLPERWGRALPYGGVAVAIALTVLGLGMAS